MLRRIRSSLSYANVVATMALFIGLGGASYAAVQLPKNSVGRAQIKANAITGSKVRNSTLTGADIKNRTLTPVDFSGSITGPAGPVGPVGPGGPAGPTGAAGTARAFGFVDNSSGTPSMQKAKGGVSVRRSGNGVFCITAPGVDPTVTSMAATGSAKSGQFGIIFVGSGLAFSQQCTNSEFQVITVAPSDFSVGVNDASFEFVIP
jgi:hypothetical protein